MRMGLGWDVLDINHSVAVLAAVAMMIDRIQRRFLCIRCRHIHDMNVTQLLTLC